jgi:hypothetical protein
MAPAFLAGQSNNEQLGKVVGLHNMVASFSPISFGRCSNEHTPKLFATGGLSTAEVSEQSNRKPSPAGLLTGRLRKLKECRMLGVSDRSEREHFARFQYTVSECCR